MCSENRPYFSSLNAKILQKCFLWAFNKPGRLLQETNAKLKAGSWSGDGTRSGASRKRDDHTLPVKVARTYGRQEVASPRGVG